MAPDHYSRKSGVAEAILAFSKLARERNLNVGIQESRDAMSVASLGLMADPDLFRYSLRSVYCCKPEDIPVFNDLFDKYWIRKDGLKHAIEFRKTVNYSPRQKGSIEFMGEGNTQRSELEDDARNTTGANRIERLRRTDFTQVSEIDGEYLDKLVDRLVREMAFRIKRRLKNGNKGIIDLRSTFRRNIGKGGIMLELVRRQKSEQKPRLIVLLDASGSMDKYSFYLLRFAYALRSVFRSVETFVFSTTLLKVSDQLKEGNIREMLVQMSQHVHNWSSGTRIGECLQTFNERHSKRVLNGRSVVIILSDGLDTGDPALLARELRIIRGRTKKLVWLNPLKGGVNYEPTARGMSAALPEVDTFRSAHNLNSLLELEEYLSNVW